MKYKGQIKNFPTEIVEKMLERQEEQGNERNVSVFEHNTNQGSNSGGFNWKETEEGHDFWENVIVREEIETFFERYPKKGASREEHCFPYPKELINNKNVKETIQTALAQRIEYYTKDKTMSPQDMLKTLRADINILLD